MNNFWSFIASQNSLDVLAFLGISAVKATLLLCFAAVLCLAFRRASAATRHLLWTSTLCASLLLPFLSVIRVWEIPILPAQMFSSEATGSDKLPKTDNPAFEIPVTQMPSDFSDPVALNDRIQKKSDLQPTENLDGKPLQLETDRKIDVPPQKKITYFLPQLSNWALAAWFAVALLLLFRLLAGFMTTGFLARRAAEFQDEALNGLFSSLLTELNLKGKVRLLRSEQTLMPVVCGVLRPLVLLPATASEWSEERRKMVLLHELTHVARRDCLTQILAQIACAFYWFNPLVWYAARRLRVEREQACDDFVLSIGTKPSDYAQHLLEIARSMPERSVFDWSQTATVAIARQSQLEGRLLAILSKENKPRAMSRMMTAGVVASICVLVFSLAVIRPTAIKGQNQSASKIGSTPETKALEKSLSDAFLTTDSEPRDGAIIHKVQTNESGGKQENKATDNESLQKETGNQTQEKPAGEIDIALNTEQNIAPPPEDAPKQNANTQPSSEANPFINAKYEQERKPEAQDKSVDFIDEMASVGYTNLSVEELVRLKVAGVTADYVRSLRSVGFSNLTVKELASMGIHGVTPAYIQAIREAGYDGLSAKELTTFRIHDITPEFIKTLRDAGFGNLAAKQLIDFAVHQVTPAFISGIRAAGYSNLSPKELVTLRVHDVTPEFIRKARSRLGELTLKQIISLKLTGVIEGKDKEKDEDQG